MSDECGVVIRAWSCPVDWHRYVRWHGDAAYCSEPGCEHSNVEPPVRPPTRAVGIPRSVASIELPEE